MKATASHNLTCECSAGAVGVVKCTASGGLQCKSELVKDNAASSRASHNQQYIAGVSHIASAGSALHISQCEGMVTDNLHIAENSKSYKVRFVYNSGVVPRQVDALLARKPQKTEYNTGEVKNRTVWYSGKCKRMVLENVSKSNECSVTAKNVSCSKTPSERDPDENPCLAVATDLGRRASETVTAKVISSSQKSGTQVQSDTIPKNRVSVNTETRNVTSSQEIPIYNVNYSAIEDKFASSIIHVNSHKGVGAGHLDIDTEIYKKGRVQSQFDFGYIPIDEQKMPRNLQINRHEDASPLDIHDIVKATGAPNFMNARIPVKSQLNVQAWKDNLKDYWD